jgi:hypothetical protein
MARIVHKVAHASLSRQVEVVIGLRKTADDYKMRLKAMAKRIVPHVERLRLR